MDACLSSHSARREEAAGATTGLLRILVTLETDAGLAGVDDRQHGIKQIRDANAVLEHPNAMTEAGTGSRDSVCGGGGVQSWEGSCRGALTAKPKR